MREPYLMTFTAFTLWGFVSWGSSRGMHPVIWFSLGILGMLLVSPVVALVTLLLFAVWMYFASRRGRLSWLGAVLLAGLFLAGLFMLASALDRGGNLGGGTPFAVINNFLR